MGCKESLFLLSWDLLRKRQTQPAVYTNKHLMGGAELQTPHQAETSAVVTVVGT